MSEFAFAYRMWRFLRKLWPEKVSSLRYRFKRLWNKAVPFVPLPTRLPWGDWWLAWNDVCSDASLRATLRKPSASLWNGF
jgi:hypothetical protein